MAIEPLTVNVALSEEEKQEVILDAMVDAISSEMKELLPKFVAKIIWYKMDDRQQGKIFTHLAEIRKNLPKDHNMDIQWLGVRDEVHKMDRATQDEYLSFCAFAYNYWPVKDEL